MVCTPPSETPRPYRSRPVIGLLTHGAGDPNSQAVWEGVQSAASEQGAHVICFPGKPLCSPHGFEAQANVIYDLAGPENVDGLVIWSGALCHRVDLPVIADFCRRYLPLPMVTVGHPLVEGIPGVVLDNYQGMHDVITHLVEFHNLVRIAFIRGPQPQPEAEQRYRAYLDVLAEHGIPLDPALVIEGNFKESGGTAAIHELLDVRGTRFDALAAASDNMALGAMKALQRRGLRIPTDIAVAGLNDEVQGRFITPPLTTATFRSYEMARRATEMLLAVLDGKPVPERVLLASRLLVRQSCGCPDPLVSEAAELPAHTHERPPAAGLNARRAAILTHMAECWELMMEAAPTPQLEKVLDAFIEETTRGVQGGFLAVLGGILQETLDTEGGVSRWQSTISILRREALPYLRDRSAWLRAENLWQQARVMLGETGQRAQAHQALEAQEETRLLAGIGQALGNAVLLADVERAIVQAIPKLGIRRAYLVLYEDPAAIAMGARLIMGCDENGPLALEPGGRSFPAHQFVPTVLPADRRCDLVLEPLFYRDEQLGFAVFEADPRLEEECDILREQIAGALKRSELYRQAEQARCVAEEGRRLAEEANQLKSRFLSTVSHELRTPLSLIVGTIEMLLRERGGRQADLPAAHQRDLRSIRTSAQHLARLISDVLDLASSQAGELRLVSEPLNLSEVLSQAAMLGEAMAREKGLAWESDLPADLPPVWGDRTRLQQVVLNLISNAVKFTEQGYVRLWAEASKRRVVVAVTDSGMGIPAAEQEFVFDEFRQSERAARRGYGGIGLGLAISKRLVELHGGAIGVLSTGADGAGSTFYFTLPVMQMDTEIAAGGEERSGMVLVLAEQAGERLVNHLAACGFTVKAMTPAAHPNWLGQIIAAPPGAIVLDFEPAVERGWELMQVLRSNPTTQDIPVIFYSLTEAEEHGAALALDFLTKPLAANTLARALARQGLDADRPGSRTILVVDDEPGILELHTRLLEELTPQCRIVKACNGQEALALMARQRPDLVLLDLMMPVLDGFGVLEAMRQCEGMRNIPVIVLTAQILTHRDMARLQQGVVAVLSKGLFTGAEVLGQVTEALRRNKRLGSEAQRVARQAMAYIHEHYAETFSREALARAVGLSDRYLTQSFHAETGVTPVVYLNRYRIRQARNLLERGELNVTEVALATGFADPSYFARVFRAEVGVTPRAYQRGERGA